MVPKIRVSLARRNASKREKLVTGFVIMSAMVILWIEGTSGTLQPNLTSVETWGETQIKVTWQPFDHVDNDKPHFYELYIDDHLEYFGNDVIYIARRLIPDSMYHFKLRSCIQESHVCSLFSKTLSGTTDQSRKRGFTKSFIQWTILYLVITMLASTAAVLGTKITRRLWRYDYRSETNLQLPKYAASTETLDEDLMSSLCLKTLPKTEGTRECGQAESLESTEDAFNTDMSAVETNVNHLRNNKANDSFKGEVVSEESSRKCGQRKHSESTELVFNADLSTIEMKCDLLRDSKSKELFKSEVSEEFTCLKDTAKCGKSYSIESSIKHAYNTDLHKVKTNCEPLNTHVPKVCEGRETAKSPCKRKTENDPFTIQRAHTSPKLKISRDLNSKRQNEGHRRALSFDSNIQKQKQQEISLKPTNLKSTKNNAIPHNSLSSVKYSPDLVVVVDNSNIFIGAQECATLLKPNERKRNIRVKIQQLVKVFQRGRVVSRAFVQGSSPPTTDQVWEIYRGPFRNIPYRSSVTTGGNQRKLAVFGRLGYCVDVEDRRGKDEQRVDEGLHLHIYKALFELPPRTLVIASGDGNKGKSECATSLPGCAEAALKRGWKVEIHSWQHSTSMEWLKLSKKYPEQLTIHYLDRHINHITFVDGKYGRKCQLFPTDAFKNSSEHLHFIVAK